MAKQRREQESVDLIDYCRVLVKHKRMIIAVIGTAVLLTLLVCLLKPALYEASATFFPMNVREHYGFSEDVISMRRHVEIEDLIVSILQSRKMADKIVDEQNLKKVWGKTLTVDARKILREVTVITLERNGIIKLAVRTKSPKLSANIANAYVDNLTYFNKDLDLGAERNIVQVIDRAVTPQRQMSRGLIKYPFVVFVTSAIVAFVGAFVLEFFQKTNLRKILQESDG